MSKVKQISCNNSDVDKWKLKSREILKSYYLGFAGSQWDIYNIDHNNVDDKKLLLAKICFAMFGLPSKESIELCDGYMDDQKSNASEILEKILEVKNKVPSKEILVGFIVISCKTDCNEFTLPLFSVFANGNPTDPKASRRYVDTQKRTYKDWDDWKENNILPIMMYAYPRRGFFTSSQECIYEFDPNLEPDIEFGTSPQCNLSSRVLKKTDTISSIVSFGCGAVVILSMFTPLAPAVLVGSAIGGGVSAVYGTSRAINRLVDKKQHKENLGDLESIMLYFSIAATPLNFTTSIVNASLARGAVVNGRIFSNSTRMFATIINFSTLGVDTVLVGFGLANMIEKYKNNQLTKLDVVQFSMSIFFFTNTLIRPQMASKIIKNAQKNHIQQYANSMTDEAARDTFNKFVNDNKGTGSIKDTSKIVRNINKIENPNSVFGGLQNAEKVIIGGRKGNTLLVTDQNQRTNRINPNKVIFSTESVLNNSKSVSLNTNCFDSNVENLKVNGKALFENMDNRQIARVNRVIHESARDNKEIFNLSLEIADSLHCENVEQFLSVVEIVAADINTRQDKNLSAAINNIRSSKNKYVESIVSDVLIAKKLGISNDLHFKDQYKAVYHYRKHGSEFSSKIGRQNIEVYLNKVPKTLINDYNLVEVITNQDKTVTKFYNKSDMFAVVVENIDSRIIKTMHNRHGSYSKFIERLTNVRTSDGYKPPNPLDPLPKYISDTMGFRGCAIHLILENGDNFEMK